MLNEDNFVGDSTTMNLTDDESYLRQSFCNVPWHHFEIAQRHEVYLCCPAFLPIAAGNLTEQSPLEIWDSHTAIAIRESILDGSFRYCDKTICPDIVNRRLQPLQQAADLITSGRTFPASIGIPLSQSQFAPGCSQRTRVCSHWPTRIQLANDRSCNLACYSCRPRRVMGNLNDQHEIERVLLLLPELLSHAHTLRMNGAGEFLVSRPYLALLRSLSRTSFPRLQFEFITNGQLFTTAWYDTLDLSGRVALIYVSVDAATQNTYEHLRQGGTFSRLMCNLQAITRLREDRGEGFDLTLAFVVSALNFREIPDFIRLAQDFRARVSFSAIRNWGHFNTSTFAYLDVASEVHPQHNAFVSTLGTIRQDDPDIDLGDLRRVLRAHNSKH